MKITHTIKSIFILILFFSLAIPAWAAETPLTSVKKEVTPESSQKNHWQIHHWETPSATPVYFIETHELPMVDIQVIFRAGSAYDDTQHGLANLTNSLLSQGTKQASADQIAEQWDMSGAVYNAAVNRDMAMIGMRSLTYPKQFALALSTLKEVMTQPTFPIEAFERTKKQIAQLLKQQEQSPEATGMKLFFNTLYSQHPYGHPTIGDLTTVTALQPEDTKKFYQQYYTAHNAMIAMVGNLTLAEAKKVSAELTEGLIKGSRAKPIPPVKKNGAQTQHVSFPSQQTHLILGQIALAKSDPNYIPLMVANHILGGGMNSRLFKQVRGEHGLAYNVGSGFLPTQKEGPFFIKLQTENNQKQKAVSLVKAILTEFMTNGPSKVELDASKHHLVKNFILQLSSNQATISSLVDIGFYGLPLNYLSTYPSKVESVTGDQIEKALKKHLSPERFVQVTVGKD